MNPCVKTDLVFRILETGKIHTGDLFHFNGMWQIRGIPREALDHEFVPDVIVTNVIICNRANSTYSDTEIGVRLIAPSNEFKKYLKEWYPKLILIGANDGEAA